MKYFLWFLATNQVSWLFNKLWPRPEILIGTFVQIGLSDLKWTRNDGKKPRRIEYAPRHRIVRNSCRPHIHDHRWLMAVAQNCLPNGNTWECVRVEKKIDETILNETKFMVAYCDWWTWSDYIWECNYNRWSVSRRWSSNRFKVMSRFVQRLYPAEWTHPANMTYFPIINRATNELSHWNQQTTNRMIINHPINAGTETLANNLYWIKRPQCNHCLFK